MLPVVGEDSRGDTVITGQRVSWLPDGTHNGAATMRGIVIWWGTDFGGKPGAIIESERTFYFVSYDRLQLENA